MSEVLNHYRHVQDSLALACQTAGRLLNQVHLIAVTKTHAGDHIRPVLEAGHRVFGENRVQEAKVKWPALRARFPGLELHLIGPLQSNKAAEAVALFDVIETIDRDKIAQAIAAETKRQNKYPQLLIQVNTGREPQKAGIDPADLDDFLFRCKHHHHLVINGLMCIPPSADDPRPHFALLRNTAVRHGLEILSMGMSSDYAIAIAEGATHVRVGSAIFGAR